MHLTNWISILIMAILLPYWGFSQGKMSIDYEQYEVQCMGVGKEKTQIMKVWSYAKNANEAVQRAKKNAVHAVMFRGIPSGENGCINRPLIKNSQITEQHKTYLDDFFKVNGPYLRYVSLSGDGTILPQDRLKVGKKYKIGVVVVVAHTELRQELERVKVINGLNTGF